MHINRQAIRLSARKRRCQKPSHLPFNAEFAIVRIYGGVHFSFANALWQQMGMRVADWAAARHFQYQW